VKEDPIYKQHRIHTTRLPSGLWLGKIVTLGKKQAITKHSLTAAVTRVPGEYQSEAEAIQSAKHFIDEEVGNSQG
jgi:hypothetical protein